MEVAVGTTFNKTFGSEGIFRGEVVSKYSRASDSETDGPLFKVKYEDGDQEVRPFSSAQAHKVVSISMGLFFVVVLFHSTGLYRTSTRSRLRLSSRQRTRPRPRPRKKQQQRLNSNPQLRKPARLPRQRSQRL
jgi:hypothetical protein